MSVLRRIENSIEAVVERGFRRAFRSQLQPVELARKLAREMDDHKSVSVAKIYVPNEYTVFLAPPDHEAFTSYEGALTAELAAYLEAHARGSGYSLITAPTVALERDDDLRAGEFGIGCRMADVPEGTAPAAAPEPEAAAPAPALAAAPVRNAAMAGVSGTQVISAADAQSAMNAGALVLVMNGVRTTMDKRVLTMGRSRDRDLVIPDPNVSRSHCEIRHVGYDYFIIDLDSTNGVEVNGHMVSRHALVDGDRIMLGTTEIRVELS